jgi:hypothetical protein
MSPTERAIRAAEDAARTRGHKLGAWAFKLGQGANQCVRDGCSCSVLVTPGDALEVVGAAVTLGCREGGNARLFQQPPPKRPPWEKRQPRKAPVTDRQPALAGVR